jgi:hypothetical protein
MKRLSLLLRGVATCAVLALLSAGCREGQKTNPLKRATAAAASHANPPTTAKDGGER